MINPAQILIERAEISRKSTSKKNNNNKGSKGIFVNRKIDYEIAKQMIASQSYLKKVNTKIKNILIRKFV